MATSEKPLVLPPGWAPMQWELRFKDTRLKVTRRWAHFYRADPKLVVDWEIAKLGEHGFNAIVSDTFDSDGDLLVDLATAKKAAIEALERQAEVALVIANRFGK